MREADVIVVGAGIMGSATARALARDGHDVVLLEQFGIGHRRGSSHGDSRIFRFSYHDPAYVAMAVESLPLWRELEAEAGRPLLTVTGGLDTGKALDDHAEAMAKHGVDFRWLDGEEVHRLFPVVSLSPDGRALFQQDAGWLAADAAWSAMSESATAHGADLREAVRVDGLREAGGRAEVLADGETYRAPVAVVTAGSWARDLVAGIGIELPVRNTRETVAFFSVDQQVVLPSLVDWGYPAVYALRSPSHGLKVGEHQAGPETDPDEEGTVSDSSAARIAAWVAERYPGVDPMPIHSETCLYTIAPDDEFLLERHGPFVVGSPCSGHGFKFAPLIGRRLAALATGVGDSA
jgi:monomeric sarcosine oxidase